jgi:xanthine dehydrogenase accessory factor
VSNELELWQFIASHLNDNERVMLLLVAGSSGSSPGRAGYKMAVAADGELCGSIGGGVMEVRLVEQARETLDAETHRRRDAEMSEPGAVATGFATSAIKEQIHQQNSANASGMICSGRQTVIFKLFTTENVVAVDAAIRALETRTPAFISITSSGFNVSPSKGRTQNADFHFAKTSETEFTYTEKLGPKNKLYIVGGGHCALALSELMAKMDFHISLFDDRPDLNTIDKNRFAHEIRIIDGYDQIGKLIPSGANNYVVVMTLGYKSDEIVIRNLLDKDFKYFGVLGSRAKMKTLLRDLEADGFASERLARIHTPIGLAINSRTPLEIAVSIVAEIISVKNA